VRPGRPPYSTKTDRTIPVIVPGRRLGPAPDGATPRRPCAQYSAALASTARTGGSRTDNVIQQFVEGVALPTVTTRPRSTRRCAIGHSDDPAWPCSPGTDLMVEVNYGHRPDRVLALAAGRAAGWHTVPGDGDSDGDGPGGSSAPRPRHDAARAGFAGCCPLAQAARTVGSPRSAMPARSAAAWLPRCRATRCRCWRRTARQSGGVAAAGRSPSPSSSGPKRTAPPRQADRGAEHRPPAEFLIGVRSAAVMP
jgi:hypothetical protein